MYKVLIKYLQTQNILLPGVITGIVANILNIVTIAIHFVAIALDIIAITLYIVNIAEI